MWYGKFPSLSRSKFGAVKTKVDGITFSSKKEAKRYAELKLLERCRKITKLELQPRFELAPAFRYNGKAERKIEYVADFSYVMDGKAYVEDVKGMKTDVYSLKRKLFLAKFGHGVEFREV